MLWGLLYKLVKTAKTTLIAVHFLPSSSHPPPFHRPYAYLPFPSPPPPPTRLCHRASQSSKQPAGHCVGVSCGDGAVGASPDCQRPNQELYHCVHADQHWRYSVQQYRRDQDQYQCVRPLAQHQLYLLCSCYQRVWSQSSSCEQCGNSGREQ